METEKQIKNMSIWTYTTIGSIASAGLAILTAMGMLVYQIIQSSKMSPEEVLSLNLKYDKALLKNIQTLRQTNTGNYLNKALKQTNAQLLNEASTSTERILIQNHASTRYNQINPFDKPTICYQYMAPYGISLGNGLVLDIHQRTHLHNSQLFEEQLQAEIKKTEETLGMPQTITSGHLKAQQHIQFKERTKD